MDDDVSATDFGRSVGVVRITQLVVVCHGIGGLVYDLDSELVNATTTGFLPACIRARQSPAGFVNN